MNSLWVIPHENLQYISYRFGRLAWKTCSGAMLERLAEKTCPAYLEDLLGRLAWKTYILGGLASRTGAK